MPNPALFISEPDVRQNASQLSMDILVSDERPMALRKSCGVDILSGAKLVGMANKTQAVINKPLGLGISGLRKTLFTVVVTVLL
jgi:hypothetical protein